MRRNWFIAAIVLAVVAIVVAVLAARLTDDDESSVETWADGICSSVLDWRASILALADIEPGELNAEALRGRIDDGAAATDELVTELRDLDPPDLQSGAALQLELREIADSLRAEYDALEADAQQALEAESPTEFLQELAALSPRFQRLLTGAASVLQRLETAPTVAAEDRAELQQAFESVESCQELRAETTS